MRLAVGRVKGEHGVRGEVVVEVCTDSPEVRFAVGSVLETDPPERGPLTVVRARPHSGGLLVRFREVSDRAHAHRLRTTTLVADSANLAPSEGENEFDDHELIGLSVVVLDGGYLGTVSDVQHPPAQDLLVVREDSGSEVLVPFVAAIVPEVDRRAGRLMVNPPPGLVDGLGDG